VLAGTDDLVLRGPLAGAFFNLTSQVPLTAWSVLALSDDRGARPP
jgi:hypothetical protein